MITSSDECRITIVSPLYIYFEDARTFIHHITPKRFDLLEELHRCGPISINDLSKIQKSGVESNGRMARHEIQKIPCGAKNILTFKNHCCDVCPMTSLKDNKRIHFDLLQILTSDALYHLWRLPLDHCGDIQLLIGNNWFRSSPPVKADSQAMKAYASPLIHALSGFDDMFKGPVELVLDDGLLIKVVFSEENLQRAFLMWYPMWEAEESKRLKDQGLANQLRSEMVASMGVYERLDRHIGAIGRLSPKERTFVNWGLNKIAGNGYLGWVRVKYRNGGIRATSLRYKDGDIWVTTPWVTSLHNKSIAKALKPILPQGEGEKDFYMNRGQYNPK